MAGYEFGADENRRDAYRTIYAALLEVVDLRARNAGTDTSSPRLGLAVSPDGEMVNSYGRLSDAFGTALGRLAGDQAEDLDLDHPAIGLAAEIAFTAAILLSDPATGTDDLDRLLATVADLAGEP